MFCLVMCFFSPELNFRQGLLAGDGGFWPPNLNLILSAAVPLVAALLLLPCGKHRARPQVRPLHTCHQSPMSSKHPEHFNEPLTDVSPSPHLPLDPTRAWANTSPQEEFFLSDTIKWTCGLHFYVLCWHVSSFAFPYKVIWICGYFIGFHL